MSGIGKAARGMQISQICAARGFIAQGHPGIQNGGYLRTDCRPASITHRDPASARCASPCRIFAYGPVCPPAGVDAQNGQLWLPGNVPAMGVVLSLAEAAKNP